MNNIIYLKKPNFKTSLIPKQPQKVIFKLRKRRRISMIASALVLEIQKLLRFVNYGPLQRLKNRNRKLIRLSSLLVITATCTQANASEHCNNLKKENCHDHLPPLSLHAFSHIQDLKLCCPHNFSISMEGLAFQARQNGMEFVISHEGNSAPIPISPLKNGKIIGFSSWDYNPGIRIGVEFQHLNNSWMIDCKWTHINITNYKHANAAADNGTLIPLWILGSDTFIIPNQFGARSSAVWKARYNTLDLNLGAAHHVSRLLILNPHFGLRAGWINQHFSVNYGGGHRIIIDLEEAPTTEPQRTIHHGQSCFRGIGARAGIDSEWILGSGWGLFYNLSGSLLIGKFQVQQNMSVPLNDSNQHPDGFNIDYDLYQTSPNLEMALGISWNTYFNRNKYHLSLKTGYEFIEWWDQFNMRKFFSGNPGYANSKVSRGNLTFNGFSLSLQLSI